MATTRGAMTAQEAARTLADLEKYDEALTAKAFGITMMAFGIAGAATAMSYAYAAEWIGSRGYGWTLSFLWIPWIFSASLVSAAVWKAHAISLQRRKDRQGSWLWSVAFSGVYIALLAGVWWLDAKGPLDIGVANHNLLTLGFFTVFLAAFLQSRYGYGWMMRTLYVVAVALVAVAFVYGALALPEVVAHLLAALTSLAIWVGAGAYIAARG